MPETQERAERIGTADVVIGLPGLQRIEDLDWIGQWPGIGQRVLIAYPNTVPALNSVELAGPHFLPYESTTGDRYLNSPIAGSFQELFQITQQAGAKCCCVWNTNPQSLTAEVVEMMLAPVLNEGFDLAVPCYAEMKLGTLVNTSIVRPLVRALYGRRISFPMAIDLALSAPLVNLLLQSDPKTQKQRAQQWITSEAICSGMKICQTNLPMQPPRPPEPADVSSILSLVLGRLFQDLERNATFWQRSNAVVPVPTFGEASGIGLSEEIPVDVQSMLQTFHLGYRNLREIWNVALPPATLLDLKRLATQTETSFHLPNDLWVRIVYDFAMAHRQRAINREHLLRAMTPLYLAWVASHALEIKDASPQAREDSREKLALAYEKQKPYLLSRWRWPDRFNP